MVFGSIAGAAFGMVQPISFIVFGSVIEKFIKFGEVKVLMENATVSQNSSHINSTHAPLSIHLDINGAVQPLAIYYVILGCGIIILGFMQIHFWSLTAVRQSYRIRKKFFESILRQDIGWFDTNDGGGLSTRLAE